MEHSLQKIHNRVPSDKVMDKLFDIYHTGKSCLIFNAKRSFASDIRLA